MKFEKKDGVWISPEGYKIEGDNKSGYEAFAPDGKMIVMWAVERHLAEATCREHLEKQEAKG